MYIFSGPSEGLTIGMGGGLIIPDLLKEKVLLHSCQNLEGDNRPPAPCVEIGFYLEIS